MLCAEMIQTNPFTTNEIAAGYESWYQTVGRRADVEEKSLLKWLLAKYTKPHTILDVGCGTGHFTRWFAELGYQVIGLDLSMPMLNVARDIHSQPYLHGDAYNLPIATQSFDLVVFITTLEFLSDPKKALQEALRVATKGIILGVINAKSQLGRQYKHLGGPIWETARFFTIAELRRMVRHVSGENVSIAWRSTLWSLWPGALPLGWGGFIGMAVLI